MTHEDAVALIAAVNGVSYSLWWVSFWIALILFFKDCSGKS